MLCICASRDTVRSIIGTRVSDNNSNLDLANPMLQFSWQGNDAMDGSMDWEVRTLYLRNQPTNQSINRCKADSELKVISDCLLELERDLTRSWRMRHCSGNITKQCTS